MGIPSLKSAILYNVSLYFHCHRFLHSLRSVEMTRVHPIRTTTASFPSTVHHCHLERPQGVERSKSCKYNHRPRKRAYFWPTSLFLTPRPRKGPFFWPPFVHFRLRPRKQPFSWTAGSFFRSRPQNRAFLWTGDEKSISMRYA